MENWLNTYQKVTSQTGKPVTLFTDNAPWRDNPWIEIRGAGRRYRNNGKGGWEIQQASQSSGTWDPVNIVDEEYWINYVNDIEKKRKETPAQNIFQKLFGIEGKTPEKACGGKVEKAEKGTKTHSYDAISRYEQDIPEETLIDRTGKHPRYTYVPGELKSHRFALDTKKVIPNLDRLMKPGEQRMYIDPTTNRILTYTGPVDPNISSVRYIEGNIGRSSTVDAMYQLPGQDIYLFPDGRVYRNVREQSNRNWLETLPHESIPINQNDNTSTDGSNNPNPIKGIPGLKPVESIQRPEGYNPDEDWAEEKDSVNGGVRRTWRNKKTGDITRINPTTSQKCGGKVQKGENGIPEGFGSPSGEYDPKQKRVYLDQGFQLARPGWLQKIQDAANELNGRPDKYGPLTPLLGPVARYFTGQGGYENMAAILPGAGIVNTAGKAAVGKAAQFEKALAERTGQIAKQKAQDLEVAGLRKKALSMSDKELDNAIENAFNKERGLREQMAKWDQELLTNADRNIIKPSWLDEFKVANDQYIKEIDPNLISGSTEPSLLGALMLGSGLGAAGGGFYLMTHGKTKKKEAEKAKAEEKACGGKMKKKK